MSVPYDVTVTTLPDGSLFCFGRRKMQPTTAPYARVSNFRIPDLQLAESTDPSSPGTPVVQVSIDRLLDDSGSDYTREMAVANLIYQHETDGNNNWLLLTIDAGTPTALDSPHEYFCNVIVIGTPV